MPRTIAQHRGQPEQQVDVAPRDGLDDADHGVVQAGRRDRADDDAGRPHRYRDADHVARAGDHAGVDLLQAEANGTSDGAAVPTNRFGHVTSEDDHHQRDDGVEHRAVCAPPLDHEQVDQDDDRYEVVGAADEGPAQRRDLCPGKAGEPQLLRLQVGDVETARCS